MKIVRRLLFIILIGGFLISLEHTLLTRAAGLSAVTYTDDTSVGTPNVVIYGAPIGDWVRVCSGGCTGWAVTLGSPALMGGFNWLPQSLGNGATLTAQNQA